MFQLIFMMAQEEADKLHTARRLLAYYSLFFPNSNLLKFLNNKMILESYYE